MGSPTWLAGASVFELSPSVSQVCSSRGRIRTGAATAQAGCSDMKCGEPLSLQRSAPAAGSLCLVCKHFHFLAGSPALPQAQSLRTKNFPFSPTKKNQELISATHTCSQGKMVFADRIKLRICIWRLSAPGLPEWNPTPFVNIFAPEGLKIVP